MKILITFFVVLSLFACAQEKADNPNIIIILADDLGYGDIQSYNPDSEIPTPNLNKFSEEGLMFTDVHTPSAVCTPTRYGLLTGRYCWRTSLKRGVLRGYSAPLINENRLTIADYLKEKGYRTGIVGKWHLGLAYHEDKSVNGESEKRFDLTRPLNISPNNYGFDYSFIHPASLDMKPYVYIRNYNVVETEFDSVQNSTFPYKWHEGRKSKSLEFDEVLDDLLLEAKDFIKRESKSASPFFLYFPLTAPHVPLVPSEKFLGTSEKGLYGDFTIQVDWTAGEIFKLLEALDIKENTLVIFTSDNGSAMRKMDSTTDPDHITDSTLRYYNAVNHKSNGYLRGIKGDTYEGGHRVPFIVRWPEKLASGETRRAAICLTDIFATLFELNGEKVPKGVAEDSYSFFPVLTGDKKQVNRPPIIHHAGGAGMYAIRKGDWKLILGNGSGARTEPVGEPFKKPYQLFHLAVDSTEAVNLIDKEAKIAAELESDFYEIKGDD